jgi:hypothetical protein
MKATNKAASEFLGARELTALTIVVITTVVKLILVLYLAGPPE